jgi:putative ABC transport system permease protein
MWTWLRVFVARLSTFARAGALDEDFEQELQAHVELLAADNIRRGMSADEARRAAAMRVGSVASLKAQHRDVRGLPLVDHIVQDIGFALRLMARNPWFSAAGIATLALGIGINAMGFTIVNAAFLRGLPFDRSDQLLMLSWLTEAKRRDEVSIQDLRDWRSQTKTFAGLAGFLPAAMNLSDSRSTPEETHGAWVTANAFGLLRVPPILGRDFSPEDERRGADRVVLISGRLWRNRYAADSNVVGTAIRLNGEPAVIAGVMPDRLTFPDASDVWAPFAPTDAREQRSARLLSVFGRLKDNTSLRLAQTDLNGIGQRIIAAYPDDTNGVVGVRVETFNDAFVGGAGRTMFIATMGAVCFVLLIACANVANLLLSRSVQRSREVALRVAMGATRARIVGQLLVESVVLGLFGGALGLLLTVSGIRIFDSALPEVGRPFFMTFEIDYAVFAYVAAISVLAAVLFGLSPALQITRANNLDVLKEGGRGGVGGRRARRLSAVMIVAELALTVVLLVGAGLMARSFLKAYTLELGIGTERLMTTTLRLPEARYSKADDRRAFVDRLEPQIAAVPGVEAVAITNGVPPFDGGKGRLQIDGRLPDSRGNSFVSVVFISPHFFDVVHAPLVRGRSFGSTGDAGGRHTAIINAVLALRFFPNEDPIGRRIRVAPLRSQSDAAEFEWRTIVGVSRPIRHGSIYDSESNPAVYLPYSSEAPAELSLLVRSGLPPTSLMTAIRVAVQASDPDQPVAGLRTLDELLADARWPLRAFGGMFLLFGITALILAAVGLYGVLAYAVTQRTAEIGVRMALGASRREVLFMVLRRGLLHLAIGLPVGVAGALAMSGVLNRALVEISPADPITFLGVAALLTVVGVAACLVPARRATAVDPTAALRAE